MCENSLRADGSGVLINVSRAISRATDMALAAKQLRDEINDARAQFVANKHEQSAKRSRLAASSSDATPGGEVELSPHQKEFIDFAVKKKVLQFGSFKLKSGRISPYFFNAGLFDCGQSMDLLGR